MTKLQYALAYTPEQIAALPPPLMRIRELEEKVGSLVRENEELRRQLEQRNADLRPDIVRHVGYRTSFDDRHTDRDIKRRRTIDHGELYIVSVVVHSHIPLSGLVTFNIGSDTTSASNSATSAHHTLAVSTVWSA